MSNARRLVFALVFAAGLALYLAYLKRLDSLVAPPKPHTAPASAAPSHSAPAQSAARTESAARVTLAGRVVDQDARPFAGLRIAARGAELAALDARTDADGAFELAALPRVALTLDLTADFDPAQPLGVRALAARVAPLAADLRSGPERVDLGTHVVPRSRPFWVHGRIELDEGWARSKGVWLGDVRLELATPGPDDLTEELPPHRLPAPGAPIVWNDPPWRAELPAPPHLEDDGTFHFAVETPHDPFFVRAWLKRFEPAEKLVWPLPDGALAETLRLPP